jgi:hypothetical protein
MAITPGRLPQNHAHAILYALLAGADAIGDSPVAEAGTYQNQDSALFEV